MSLLIKNANIINPDGIKKSDIYIEKGIIKKISSGIRKDSSIVIDVGGKYVAPGFIDIHTHLRTPGREDKETIKTGSQAAVKGGFTTIMCMPNTEPPIDNYEIALRIRKEAQKIGLLDVFPVGSITKGRAGKELSEFAKLKEAGCLALSDDGSPVADASLLRKALEYGRLCDMLLISHCEDESLSKDGILRESELTAEQGILSIPDIAETVIVAREIEMARYLKAKIHLAHISNSRSMQLIERAKKDGVKVTAETCPHYFSLNLDDIRNNMTSNYKINPPLGTKEDMEKIRKGLSKNIIDCISTDHAPHTFVEKNASILNEAEFGIIGLETAFSLSLRLVEEKYLTLEKLVEKMSSSPADILSLSDRGRIKEGLRGDLVIIDTDKEWKVTEESIKSKSKNTPFMGQTLKGAISSTIYKGNVVYKDD